MIQTAHPLWFSRIAQLASIYAARKEPRTGLICRHCLGKTRLLRPAVPYPSESSYPGEDSVTGVTSYNAMPCEYQCFIAIEITFL